MSLMLQGATAPPPVGGVPVLEGFTGNTTGGTAGATLTLTKPAGVVVGNTLLLLAADDPGNPSLPIWNNLTGWAKPIEFGDNTSDSVIAGYWRTAAGGEGATIDVTGLSNTQKVGWYARVSGAHASAPIHAIGTRYYGAGSSHTIPSVTSTIPNTLAVYFLAFDGGDGFPFTLNTAGWTQEDEMQSNATGHNVSACWGTKPMPVAGPTGDVNIDSSVSDGAVGVIFLLTPLTS